MTSTIREGAQPARSRYRTVNVMVVDGVPEPGVALPADSVGALCEAPLQLAATAFSEVMGSRTAANATAAARTAARAVRIPADWRCVMCGWFS
jgi:hypothetical protein